MVNRNQPLLGKVFSLDAQLRPAADKPARLSLRGRGREELYFLTSDHRLITVAPHAWGRGPNRILVEQTPPEQEMLIAEGWRLSITELQLPTGEVLSLSRSRWVASNVLEPIKEFPGHLRLALNRLQKRFTAELEGRLQELARALKMPLAESVELPLIRVLGFGEGNHPDGDAALCGLLLTGRAFSLGKRLRVHWLPRLVPEIRRFLHRTPKISAALIRFAIEGRTTERQERFFTAMGRDYESAVEAALETLIEASESGSLAFLSGVRTALDMVWQDLNLGQPRAIGKSPGTRAAKA